MKTPVQTSGSDDPRAGAQRHTLTTHRSEAEIEAGPAAAAPAEQQPKAQAASADAVAPARAADPFKTAQPAKE